MEAILFPASNLKMFCSSCGQNCPLEAKYCHKCGVLLKQYVTEGAGSVDEGSKKDESGTEPSTSVTGSGIGASGLLSFAQFRARKEEDRSKHLRNKPGKKLKRGAVQTSSAMMRAHKILLYICSNFLFICSNLWSRYSKYLYLCSKFCF